MKKVLLFAVCLAGAVHAQEDRPTRLFPYDPINPCSVITPNVNNWIAGRIWQCVGTSGVNHGTWRLVSQSTNPWIDPGFWNNEEYLAAVDARIGIAVNPDLDRLYITNAPGHRPAALSGDIHPPADPGATVYEGDAVAGIVINQSTTVNGVAGSFFGVLGRDGSSGLVSTSGTAVTRLTGPSFLPIWQGTFITINGVEYAIQTVTDGDHVTLSSTAGTQTAVAWFKRIYTWGLNVLLSDGLPGAMGAPHYKYGYFTNEWDVNIFDATSKLIMHSIGGNGTVQPALALGYTVNTMSASNPGLVKWTCGFCLLDGVASVAMQIGVAGTDNNFGSMPILFYSRDSMGNVNGGTLSTDPTGNFLFHPGFSNVGGGDQQTIFLDRLSNVILGISGKGSGGPGVVQGGSTTRFQPGSDVLTNLAAEGGSANVFCSNCDTPVTEGAVCTASGDHASAWAIRLRGAWHCF